MERLRIHGRVGPGLTVNIGDPGDNGPALATGETIRRDEAFEMGCRQIAPRRSHARIEAFMRAQSRSPSGWPEPKRASKRSNNRCAVCTAPPSGRPGLAEGVQP